MIIKEMDFENYSEVDCKARNMIVSVKQTGVLPFFSLSIRRTGKNQYQAYAKFSQDILYIQASNGQTFSIGEAILKEGTLVEVVDFTNQMTGSKDTVSRAIDPKPAPEDKKTDDMATKGAFKK